MRVRVLLFAGLREAVGEKSLDLELEAGLSLRDLIARVEAEQPALVGYRGRLLISVNEQAAPLSTLLNDGDEVALLPPVSGGSDRAWVQSEPLSMDRMLAEVIGDDMGAVVTFTGTVRDNARGEDIDHLEYEAYVPMAEKEMRKIADRARQRWPHLRLSMAHRIGRLEIGDSAVMIAVAAPHRAEAFEAGRFLIDTLKQSVPIWKKEFAKTGAYWVEENP